MNAKTVCSISVLAVALTLGAIPGWAQSDAVTVWSRIAPLDNVCPPSQAQKDLSDRTTRPTLNNAFAQTGRLPFPLW